MNKFIVVDDHDIFRESIKLIINNDDLGEVVAEASNGQMFLELLNIYTPDLVIMDIEMPVMNGLDATKKALEIYPDLKILILTMFGEKATVNTILKSGAQGFLLKSSGKTEFENAISAVLSNQTYYVPKNILV